MNVDDLEKRWLLAARALPSRDDVPYLFEKRIMAALTAPPQVDLWAEWSRSLWRAAAPFVGIMLVISAWTALSSTPGLSTTLGADFDRTVWGPLTSLNESW